MAYTAVESPTSEEEVEEVRYTNYYACPCCGHEWEDVWSCACNDHCPGCDKEIEPYISDDGSVTAEQIHQAYVELMEERSK